MEKGMKSKKLIALWTAVTLMGTMAGCKSSGTQGGESTSVNLPGIDTIKLGEDYQDIQASIKILTNRTDIVDTVYIVA